MRWVSPACWSSVADRPAFVDLGAARFGARVPGYEDGLLLRSAGSGYRMFGDAREVDEGYSARVLQRAFASAVDDYF